MTSNSPENTTRGTVLVVDDSAIDLVVLCRSLRKENYQVIEATTGQEGMEKAMLYSPDIIISDAMMPVMNGFEFCRQIRKHKDTQDVFFIMVTGLNDSEHRVEGLEGGCDDYLHKPVVPRELILRVNAAMRLKNIQHELSQLNTTLSKELAEKTRLHEENQRELEIAKSVQDSLRPGHDMSLCPSYLILNLVESSDNVGGDYVDVIQLEEHKLGLVLVDVSGHGVPSAIVTGMSHAWVRSQLSAEIDLSSFISKLNSYIYNNTLPEMYLTAFIGVLDTTSGHLAYVSAGHPEAICFWEGHAAFIEETDVSAIGLFPEISVQVQHESLDRGQGLFVYSDGLSDLFGDSRTAEELPKLVLEYIKIASRDNIDLFCQRVLSHTDAEKPGDDVSILLIQRR